MKPYKLILAGFFILLSMSLNAQLFVGGNVNFNTSGDKTQDTNSTIKISSYNLNINPRVGLFLSDDFAVGLALNLGLQQNKSNQFTDILHKVHSVGFNPFARYYALRWNKLSLYGQGNVQLLFSGSKTTTGTVTTEGPKTTTIGLSIYPGLSYDISDRISLETSIHILSFNLSYASTKDGTTTEKNTTFGLGGGISNIVNTGNITIGAIYRF